MRNIEDNISTLIKTQFPTFYEEEGPNFVEFAKEYYKYLEASNNALYYSRNLLEYRDIDKTIDGFVVHFKEKYLKYFPYELAVENSRFLIKHIMDFYRSKGSERSYEIFFKSVYNTVPTFYYPKEDVFKLSDGLWVKSVYVELSNTTELLNLLGKQITGSTTGATGFVENIVRRKINNRLVNVAYLSDVEGTFSAGEIATVASDPVTANMPRILGSLSSADVITGGENFAVGDTLTVTTGNGKSALLRVTAVETQTGIVRFTFVDGGYGFIANVSQVLVSTKVLDLAANASNIQIFETVSQPMANIEFTSANGTFVSGDVVEGRYANNDLAGNAVVMTATYTSGTAGFITISTRSGNTANGTGVVYKQGNTIGAVISTYTDTTASGNVMGQNTTSIGVVNVTGTFVTSNNNYIVGANSGVNTTITSIGSGTGATFKVGTLTNTEAVRLDNTFLRDKNTGNVSFMSMRLDGSNANVYSNSGPYGFAKNPGGSNTAILLSCFDIQDYTIGTVASLVSQDGGQNYTKAPFVRIYESRTASYNKRDVILNITGATRNFGTGEIVRQTSTSTATLLTVNNFTGNSGVIVGEVVYQNDGTSNIAVGTVYSASVSNTGNGNGTITIITTSGTFVANATATGNNQIRAEISQANAKVVIANNSFSITTTGRGIVRSNSNTSVLFLKRLTFADTFGVGNTVIGADSGAEATIVTVDVDYANSYNIGNNSVVSANVIVANNTITSVDVSSSGFGYLEGETVTAVNTSNTQQAMTATLQVQTQGYGEGHYESNKGFLSADKYLYDGEYYQDYSYEIQSKIPFDQYSTVLKQLIHVAGTKMFGNYILETEIANTIITTQSAEIST